MSRLDPTANRIVLRPRFFDRLCVVFLVWPGLVAIALGISGAFPIQPTTLHCDRTSGQCVMTSSSIFHNESSITVPIEKLWLGHNPTPDENQLAANFRAFVADGTRATFDATWRTVKPPPPAIAIVMGLLLVLAGGRWWRGWYSELELAGDEIIIRQRPMFFTGPRERRFGKRDVQLVEGVENRYVGRGQRAKFARIELRAEDGKPVFRYSTLYDKKSRAVLDGYMQLLASHISRS